MADSALTGGTGAGGPIRVLTALGAGNADQQVVTLADSAGNLLGTAAAGVPVAWPDTIATGTITASDAVVAAPAGGGALVSGASTAGSIVAALDPGGMSAWNVQLTGTFGGGTVYFEESVDSTNGTDGNWINVNARQTGVVNTTLGYSATAAGVFRGNVSGAKYLRVRMVGGASPNVAVTMRVSAGPGAIFLNASIPAGTNNIGIVSSVVPTPFTLISAATTNVTSVKASAGTMFGLNLSNSGAAAAFVKLFNKASAPVLGTDLPALTIPIPASGMTSLNLGELGHRFTAGIALAVTNLVADTDATAVALNQVKVLLDYV